MNFVFSFQFSRGLLFGSSGVGPSPRTWVGFVPGLEAVWWAEIGGLANSWRLINAHSSLWTLEGRTRYSPEDRVQALQPSHSYGLGGLLQCQQGPRAMAEDYWASEHHLRVDKELSVHLLRAQVGGGGLHF